MKKLLGLLAVIGLGMLAVSEMKKAKKRKETKVNFKAQ